MTTGLAGFVCRRLGVPAFAGTTGDLADDALDAFDHARQLVEVHLVRRVGEQMVVRIAEHGRVGDHHGLEAVLHEGPVVRPADAGNDAGRDSADAGECRVRPERPYRLL